MCLASVIKRQIQFIVLTVFVPFQLSKNGSGEKLGVALQK